jgi:hypothetical protein
MADIERPRRSAAKVLRPFADEPEPDLRAVDALIGELEREASSGSHMPHRSRSGSRGCHHRATAGHASAGPNRPLRGRCAHSRARPRWILMQDRVAAQRPNQGIALPQARALRPLTYPPLRANFRWLPMPAVMMQIRALCGASARRTRVTEAQVRTPATKISTPTVSASTPSAANGTVLAFSPNSSCTPVSHVHGVLRSDQCGGDNDQPGGHVLPGRAWTAGPPTPAQAEPRPAAACRRAPPSGTGVAGAPFARITTMAYPSSSP